MGPLQYREPAARNRAQRHRRVPPWAAGGLLVLVTLVFASGAAAAELSRIVLRGGPTVGGNDPGGADAVDLAIGIEPARAPGWLRVLGERVQFEFSGGWLVNAEPPKDALAVGRAGLVWRFHPAFLREHRFLEAGPGIAYRSGDRVNGRDQGTKAQFSLQVTIGTHFGPDLRRRRLALRWQHTSNAGTGRPNPGLDLLLLEVGYRWGDAPPVSTTAN